MRRDSYILMDPTSVHVEITIFMLETTWWLRNDVLFFRLYLIVAIFLPLHRLTVISVRPVSWAIAFSSVLASSCPWVWFEMLCLIKDLYFMRVLILNVLVKTIDLAVTLNAELNGNTPFWTSKELGLGVACPDRYIVSRYHSVILCAT